MDKHQLVIVAAGLSTGKVATIYMGGYGVGETERQSLADLRRKLVAALAEVDRLAAEAKAKAQG